MKKLLLGLGAIAAVTAPIVAIVACSNDNGSELDKAKAKLIAGSKDLTDDQKARINGAKSNDDLKKIAEKIDGENITNKLPNGIDKLLAESALAIEKSFSTAAEFNTGTLVNIKQQTGDYLRNQFLFAPDTLALENVLKASGEKDATIASKKVTDSLDRIQESIIGFKDNITSDAEFKKISDDSIVIGTFVSARSTGTDDDSILVAINNTDKATAIELLKNTLAFMKKTIESPSTSSDASDEPIISKADELETLHIFEAIVKALK